MKTAKIAAWAAAGLAIGATLLTLAPPAPKSGMDIEAFGHLPVLEGGRVKPIDSVARNTLLMLRSKQTVRDEGETLSADEWLLDLMFRPAVADMRPSFYVDDPEVLSLFGFQQTSQRYFSFATIKPHIEEVQKQAQAAQQIDAKQRTRFQSAIVNLYERLYLYFRLENTVQMMGSNSSLMAEIASRGTPQSAQRQSILTQLAYFRPLPPPAGASPDAWQSVGEALRASGTSSVEPNLEVLAGLGQAWASQDSGRFNEAVSEMRGRVMAGHPGLQRHADAEILFNRAQPFYAGMVIYVIALLTLFVSWIWLPAILQPVAFALLGAGALVHTTGLVARIWLQGRPPVTNLYSSAIFVGWVAVLLGIVLERIYRKGFGLAVAAASGFASLIIAHHLASDGDTMEMMRAVLDSNFWLATHVVSITIGYSGTFLAGALAIAYTIRRQLAPSLDPANTKALVSMTYGVLCFSLLFSFVGTVLGGIWADQSWGRFWGWDPKENGALLIVLWNAIILHARWGGYVREKGIMAMAIFGNVITSLSWFGVNMLGIGLHSYGFMDKAFWALSAFIASQLVLMGFCLLPRQFWRTQQAPAGPASGSSAEASAPRPV
jgi:ABC-type transport system involved in cytochrome c biogenesis permease subunit